jgi:hypothetical protein
MSNTEITSPQESRYTEVETARILGFKNRITLWRARKRKAIGYYLLGNRVFYGERHIAEFLARCERKPRSIKEAA